MIKVTQLNGHMMVVNDALISHIESGANTVISLTTGNKIVVRESPDEIVNRCIAYQREAYICPLTLTQTQTKKE